MSETTTETTVGTVAETSGDTTTGTTTGTATEPTQKAATTTGTTDADKALGDAGKKAIDTMKAERNTAREAQRKAEADLAALRAQAEGKEAEHKATLEAQRVKDEALSAANERILKAEVRAAATAKLTDPQDALRFLDLSEFEVDSDGGVNAAAINKAIDDLIADKPYLAAQGQRFQGGADGGARNDANTPTQLTQSDMDRMTPEQINDAFEKGQFSGLLKAK